MAFFSDQVREIRSDRALTWFGGALALVNVLTAVFWLIGEVRLPDILDPTLEPVCWPFWRRCHDLRLFDPAVVSLGLKVFALLSVANAALFIKQRWVGVAYAGLLCLSIVKYGLILLDYRLILNHHYMALWALAVFAFWPGKRAALPALLCLFYFWAGMLKLDPASEWLSGAAMYGRRPFGMPQAWVPASCGYVMVLELVGTFGLLTRGNRAFIVTFGQFLVFHIASFWVVGFFYPILMFLLLSILPLSRWIAPPDSSDQRRVHLRWRLAPLSTLSLVALFSLFQLIPRFIPGDSALTGEGRLFALNMFDAPMTCLGTIEFRDRTDRAVGRPVPLRAPYLNTRIMCDPIVYLGLARNRCGQGPGASDEPRFELVLRSRRVSERTVTKVIDIPNFCAADPDYAVWSHNWWISR